jgi:acetyltransferase-like isoleucine patch superfamily enzyme
VPNRSQTIEFWRKWRWYERNRLPWRRAAIYSAFARRRAFVRWPVHGEVLEMLREGRLVLGEQVHFEPDVWITGSPESRISIGGGTFLNRGVMVSAMDRIEIGAHCMFANGCLITDANHRFDDVERPVPWQGFSSKGPVTIGDNVWAGANVVITTGVTIGRRTVIGANSVVTSDLPEFAVCAGTPARVLRRYGPGLDDEPRT